MGRFFIDDKASSGFSRSSVTEREPAAIYEEIDIVRSRARRDDYVDHDSMKGGFKGMCVVMVELIAGYWTLDMAVLRSVQPRQRERVKKKDDSQGRERWEDRVDGDG